MKKYTILTIAALLTVGGCRPYEDSDDNVGNNGGSATPDIGAAQSQLQSASAAGTPYVGITNEELGFLAEVPTTETSNIQSSREFDFRTSRKIMLELDIEEARGLTTDVTLCSVYTLSPEGFDINYDSCLFESSMVDGRLLAEFSVVNHIDRLAGIVWFPNEGTTPVYREFLIE